LSSFVFRLDETLRTIIYKLIPGLYEKEKERKLHFLKGKHAKQQQNQHPHRQYEANESKIDCKEWKETLEHDDDNDDNGMIFFSPTEPIR